MEGALVGPGAQILHGIFPAVEYQDRGKLECWQLTPVLAIHPQRRAS